MWTQRLAWFSRCLTVRKSSTLCVPFAVYAQNRPGPLNRFSLHPSQNLLSAHLLVIVALSLGTVISAGTALSALESTAAEDD